jgi:hypothetical protein
LSVALYPMFDRFIFLAVNVRLYWRHWKLVKRFRKRLGRWPDIAVPGRYAERMLWRKVVDHNPLFPTLVDKLAAKEYVRMRCPEVLVPRTLWEGDDADEIPGELLRSDVWVKANHGCDFNLHVGGGDVPDRGELKAKTDAWLREVFGKVAGEWAYSRVKPRLFVEEAIQPAEAGELWEFEIRVAKGRFVLGSMVKLNKRPGVFRVFFDEEGRSTLSGNDAADAEPAPPPVGLDYLPAYREAVRHAAKIGAEIDYARVDFYWDGARVYAGEITIYPASGSTDIFNEEVSRKTLSDWRLSDADFLARPQRWPASVYAGALRRALARAGEVSRE